MASAAMVCLIFNLVWLALNLLGLFTEGRYTAWRITMTVASGFFTGFWLVRVLFS